MTNIVDHARRWAPSIAAAICLLVAGWIWMPQEQGPRGLGLPRTLPMESGAQDNTDDLLDMGAQQLLERPLFHVSRRPPKEAEQVQTAPIQVTLALTGVLDSDNVQIALLRLSNSPELLRRRVGETVGEWTILSITKTTVSVRDANGQEQLIGLSSANQ